MMGFRLCQTMCFECSLCGNLIDDEERNETAFEVVLFGAVNYAVCPICLNTHVDKDDPEWRKKVDDWIKNH